MPRILPILFVVLAGAPLFADIVTLKDGRQISGPVESGNVSELHIRVGDQLQTIDIHEVQAIQFGVSLPAPPAAAPPPKGAETAPATPEPAPAQPNSMILNDGTHVAGRLWSIDAVDLHFLVNKQLQHYPRHDVLGVTFGNATLPPPRAVSAQPPAGATQPARAPALVPPASPTPPGPPTLTRPSAAAPSPAPPRTLSQPEEIGMVYFWNGKALIALEASEAAEHTSRSTQYWEIPGAQSRIRLSEASTLVFILRLPKGVNPTSYVLFPLVTVDGSRRTRSQAGRRGSLVTWPIHIEINDDSSLITYAITARDLPAGEYSFSQTGSNDTYCFGVDASTPGQ